MDKKYGINIQKPAIEIAHTDLEIFDSPFKTNCPECNDGLLLVMRDPFTFKLSKHDRCITCGQHFIYTDKTIAGEEVT